MSRSRLLGCLMALCLVGGCATLHLRHRRGPVPVPPPPPDGYVIQGTSVVFVFDPARYDSVTASAPGERAALAGIRIESVNVVGGFNGWSRTAWLMSPDHRGSRTRFTLSHRLAEVGAASEYAFRFLVNDRWWVDPSARTWNRAPAGSTPGAYELVLKLE